MLVIFGMTTESSALTRRLVTLIASSRITNDVCSEASWTRTSTAFAKVSRAFVICCPPFEPGVVGALDLDVDRLEDGHLHAGDVVDADLHLLLRRADALDHRRLDVARRVLHLRQRKVALLERLAHLLLHVEDRSQHLAQPRRQRVRLLLQKAVALLGADELRFHQLGAGERGNGRARGVGEGRRLQRAGAGGGRAWEKGEGRPADFAASGRPPASDMAHGRGAAAREERSPATSRGRDRRIREVLAVRAMPNGTAPIAAPRRRGALRLRRCCCCSRRRRRRKRTARRGG